MTWTTQHVAREDQERRAVPRCHDGEGTLNTTFVLGKGPDPERRLMFLHDCLLPPGATIGVHPHHHEEEYYFFVHGRGMMTLDGVAHPVGPGDLTAIYPGGSHGLANTGSEELRVLVFAIRR